MDRVQKRNLEKPGSMTRHGRVCMASSGPSGLGHVARGDLTAPVESSHYKRCRHSESCSAKTVAPSGVLQHDLLQLIFPIGVPCSFHYAGLVCVFPATRLCFGGCEQSSQVPRGGYCLGLLGVVHRACPGGSPAEPAGLSTLKFRGCTCSSWCTWSTSGSSSLSRPQSGASSC